MRKPKKKSKRKSFGGSRLGSEVNKLAMSGCDHEQAADALGLTEADLRQRLSSNPRLARKWREGRLRLILTLKASLLKAAQAGKVSAIRQLEGVLRAELSGGSTKQPDFNHVPTSELCEIVGVTRRTLDRWRTQHGLKRSADRTYDLAEVFAWLESYYAQKHQAGDDQGDDLRRVKAERLRAELAEKRGELLDRQEVICGLIARHQILIRWARQNFDELGRLCQGQKAERIEEILKKSFDQLKKELCNVPSELQISGEPEKHLKRCLETLK
jgi:phage terminase Nu1 subunit (DNA packaging protein)